MRKTVLALFLLAGCDSHSHDDHSHGAAPPERTIRATAWSGRFEIFMEHPALVAGALSRFVVHVTDLTAFEPRSAGPITMSFRREGAAPVDHPEASPTRPGIYIPKVVLPEPGAWSLAIRIPIDGTEALVPMPSLTVYAGADEAEKADLPEPPEGIAFLKEQQWKLGTRTAVVAKRRVVDRLRRPGRVVAKPGSRASVTAPVEGTLVAAPGRALPALGERVESGQVVALVQPPFSDFSAKVAEARANDVRTRLAQEQADTTLERVRKLHAANAKTARELQEAEFAARTAAADQAAAKAIVDAYGRSGLVLPPEGGLPSFELRAPVSGVVVELHASPGEHVDPERPVMTLLDPSVVHIEARFPEADIARISPGAGAFYELPGSRGTFLPILGEGKGRVAFQGLEVDPQSRTVSLVYELPNPEGKLRVGMSLALHVEAGEAQESPAVPLSAVVDEELRHVVFVQLDGETFEKRDVALGARDAGWIQVLGGVAEGERIVTHGAYAVRLASLSTSLPAHGHAH